MASRDLKQAVSGVCEPATAWVVLGSSGQWSDWSQWAVCVCLDEQTAKDRVGELSSATRIHWAAKPGPGDDETFDDWWDRPKREAQMAAWEAGCAAIDERADTSDQSNYRACEVPLVAEAAGTAERRPNPREDK